MTHHEEASLQCWTVGPFAENTYLLACTASGKAALIDPGDKPDLLWDAITSRGLTLDLILLTHAHLDHVGALTPIRERSGAPVLLHPDDDWLLAEAHRHWASFGRSIAPIAPAERQLAHGEVITLGELQLTVLHTPGHTPGSVCFYLERQQVLIGGDTLFHRSVGRTDLPGGNSRTLVHSIREQLWPLPDATQVLPGHGEPTTIGEERLENPFVGQSSWNCW